MHAQPAPLTAIARMLWPRRGILTSCPVVLAADPPAMVMLHGTALQPLAGPRYQTMRALGPLPRHHGPGRAGRGGRRRPPRLVVRRELPVLDPRLRPLLRRLPPQGWPSTRRSRSTSLPRSRRSRSAPGSIDEKIRAAQSLESTYDEWEGIMDVLGRMTSLVGGQDVAVPAAYVSPVLSGLALDQFRAARRATWRSRRRAPTRTREERGRRLRPRTAVPGRAQPLRGPEPPPAPPRGRRRPGAAGDRADRGSPARGGEAGRPAHAGRQGLPAGLGRLRPHHHDPAPDDDARPVVRPCFVSVARRYPDVRCSQLS